MPDLSTFIASHLPLSIAIAVTLVLLTVLELVRLRRGNNQLSPARMTQLINRDNAAIIDIRAADAFKKGHIIDAQSISAKDIRDGSKKLDKLKSRPIIIVCETGMESQKIAAYLAKQGYNVHSLTGGLRNWRDAQLPLVKE